MELTPKAAKISLPVMIIGPILAAAMSGGATWTASTAKIQHLEYRVEDVQKRIDTLQEEREQHALRLEKIETRLEYMQETLDRIEEHVRRR